MTVSICVREPFQADGEQHHLFGVAVTTKLPGVGALSPFVSSDGAVAIQSHVNPTLGERVLSYLDDGIPIGDAVRGLLNAEPLAERRTRQIHGVDREETVTVSGSACVETVAEYDGDHFTVAGNQLTDKRVVIETAEKYAETAFGERPLASRLIEALAAGHAVGGDKRTQLTVQSAALNVVSTRETLYRRFYNDLRVDATETPIADLRTTYEAAMLGFEQSLEKYAATDEIADVSPSS